MKEEFKTQIEVEGKKYTLYFDLNVMEAIQEEYKTLENWAKLTDGESGEINVKALIFGLTEMINEGIDIANGENNAKEPFLSRKQVGRLITKLGIEEMAKQMNQVVVDSTKNEEKN